MLGGTNPSQFVSKAKISICSRFVYISRSRAVCCGFTAFSVYS
jgi:hypothetical protein